MIRSAIGLIAIGSIGYLIYTFVFPILTYNKIPILEPDGRLSFDAQRFRGSGIQAQGNMYTLLSEGDVILDEYGFGIKVLNSNYATSIGLRSQLDVIGAYIIVSQTDREIGSNVLFTYYFERDASTQEFGDGFERKCLTRFWADMTSTSCGTHEIEHKSEIRDLDLTISWPLHNHSFITKDDLLVLILGMCNSGYYRVVEGECWMSKGRIYTRMRPFDNSAPTSSITFEYGPENENVRMIIEPNIQKMD